MAITKQQRTQIEHLVYEVMEELDKSKTNLEYYKTLFSKMSDKEFEVFLNRPLCFRFHHKPFVVEPTYSDIKRAADVMGVPLCETVYNPDVYVKDGFPLETRECPVVYFHIKRMKQILSKKNSNATNITKRDMKTGRLTHEDKGSLTSDNEMNALIVMGLDKTATEFVKPKADAMDAKSQMYNSIKLTGQTKLSDMELDEQDSIAKNTINSYMIASHLYCNMINTDYMLPYTLKDSKRKEIKTM